MADGRVTIELQLDDKGALKGVKGLNDSFQGVGKSADTMANKIKNLVTSLGVFKMLQSAFDTMRQSMSAAIDRVDILNRFPLMMEAMGFSALESEASIQKLSDGIQGLPTRLDEVAATAQNIAILTNDIDMATDTTLALNNAFLASGSSSDDAKRGLQQYVQMLSRGEVDMQSWRTLQETMGVALNDTAEAFGFAGRSAQSDLYDALQDGTVTFDEFNDKIIELSNNTGGFADRALIASRGIKTSMANVKTAVVTGLANAIQTVDEAMQEGGFGSIADNFDKIKEAIQASFRTINDILAETLPPIFEGLGELTRLAIELEPALLGLATAILVFKLITGFGDFIYNVHFNMLLLKESVLATWGVIAANPIVAVIAVIAGLIVVFVRLWQTNEDFRNAVINIWETIKTTITSAVETVVSWLSDMGIEISEVGEWFSQLWERTKELATSLKTLATDAIGNLIQKFKDINIDVSVVGETFQILKERVAELWGSFQDSQAFQILIGLFEFAVDKVIGFKDAVVALVRDFDFEPMIQQVIQFIPKLVALFVSQKLGMVLMGVKLIENIAEGMGLTVPELIEKVTETIVSVINKFAEELPKFLETGTGMLTNIIEGITSVLPQLIETAVKILLALVEGILGSVILLLNVGIDILTTIIEGIVTMLPILIETALDIITTLLAAIIAAVPVLIEAGLMIITTIIESIITVLPLIIEAAINIVVTLLEAIISALPTLIDAGLQIIMTLVESIITLLPVIIDAGITLILTLVESLISMLPAIIDAAITLITALIEGFISMIPMLIDSGITLVISLTEGLISMIPALMSAAWEITKALVAAIIQIVPALITAGIDLIVALISGLWEMLSSLLGVGKDLMSGLLDAIMGFVGNMFSSGARLITELISGAFSLASNLYSTVSGMVTGMVGKVTEKVSNFRTAGSNVINGIIGGVSSKIGNVTSAVSTGMSNALSTVTGFVGRFKSAGANIAGSIADGIKNSVSKVTGAMSNLASKARSYLPFSPAKEGPFKDLHKIDFGWAFEKSLNGSRSAIEHAMQDVLEGARRHVDVNLFDDEFGSLTLPSTSRYMPQAANASMQQISNNTSTSQIINNESRPTINIEKIENHTADDIPRILEEAAWILDRQERG